VSWRTAKASPIAALVQPANVSRIARARSASPRSQLAASAANSALCSAVARTGDLPAMTHPPNQSKDK
jgi:hypothetical protein